MRNSSETALAQLARQALEWGRTLTEPALRAAVDGLPGSVRHLTGYHLGWWDERGQPQPGDGGKAVRPALVLLCAEAVGGRADYALPGAVAVELVHNFSLLHDDVMDADETRRHRPTVWKVFGAGPAILTGDALLSLAFDVIAAGPRPHAAEATRMLSAAVADLIEGQGEDLAFEERDDVTLAECVSMARKKTAALIACGCALGAHSGGATAERIDRWRAFGEDVGLAFQFADDLLGIWGDPRITGKPVHSDLRSRKKTLPVVAAWNSGSVAGEQLAESYADESHLGRLADLVELAGGRDWCDTQIEALLERAARRLAAAGPVARAEELGAVARFGAYRDR